MALYNATNRKAIREAEKAAAQADADRGNFVAAAMSTREGRAWFHDLLSTCHIFHTTFSSDALGSAFAEGWRASGLRAYNDIMRHCPQHFITMMQEASALEQANERRRDIADAEPEFDDDPEPDPGSFVDYTPGPGPAKH